MNEIFMHYLTREEVTRRAKEGYAIVVPLAATEQHGPHLPVFTDSLICEHIVTGAIRKAAETVRVLMMPVLTVGCSQHHLSFGGTLSFTSMTYMQMLRDIGESLVADGFKKIIFINAHGGNESIMVQTANDLAVKHPVWVASTAYWRVARSALMELNASEIGMVPGHAGGFESAAVMALMPELVRTERMQTTHVNREWIHASTPGTFIGRHGELTGYDGYTDAPHKATAEAGRIYLETIVNCVADWLESTVRAMEQGETTV
jgi:creatinine amidohydrolase